MALTEENVKALLAELDNLFGFKNDRYILSGNDEAGYAFPPAHQAKIVDFHRNNHLLLRHLTDALILPFSLTDMPDHNARNMLLLASVYRVMYEKLKKLTA
jgi:hypothetical protein